MNDVLNDFINAKAVFDLRKHKRTAPTHSLRVAFHDLQVRANASREISLVDDEQVRLRDSGATLAWDFISAANIDDLDSVIRKFTAEARSQIVAAGFNEQDVRLELAVQFFEREQVRGNVFADGGVWTTPRLDSANAFSFKRTVLHEKFAILSGENVIRHGGHAHPLAQTFAKLKHQRGLPAADRAADADGEGTLPEISRQRPIAFIEVTGMLHRFMRVSLTAVFVMMSAVKKNAHNQL
jgi:hypothetical protein